ncbi:hypothetical protein [Kumtagia ephedrae]|jgi:hypothetical protein|uniref:Uncharacterized protein n=1 Tax=Kumtagia ephedrae TaxID=2116701 RepID=A0A2P7SAK1_9HYPH|nr:hypothetical protein [Mesorhizobium ephedrae]PSJ59524.1 hypothetical protein C7I84_12865 [Mesorhizobium ephedrae]
MTSADISSEKMTMISHLVRAVSLHGPDPGAAAKTQAAQTAAQRTVAGRMSESDLRAVIYDSLFLPRDR